MMTEKEKMLAGQPYRFEESVNIIAPKAPLSIVSPFFLPDPFPEQTPLTFPYALGE